jgi:methylated-DNA-protein-cysteine methyltransferase related protein
MQRRGGQAGRGRNGIALPSGTGRPPASSAYRDIYAVVAAIPYGRVATYGQVAVLAGLPGRARMVGYAMSALTDPAVPWHRVINAKGEISPRADGAPGAEMQRLRLESEGVLFDRHGRVSLARYQWLPAATTTISFK